MKYIILRVYDIFCLLFFVKIKNLSLFTYVIFYTTILFFYITFFTFASKLTELPEEIKDEVFNNLSKRDLCSLRQTNKKHARAVEKYWYRKKDFLTLTITSLEIPKISYFPLIGKLIIKKCEDSHSKADYSFIFVNFMKKMICKEDNLIYFLDNYLKKFVNLSNLSNYAALRSDEMNVIGETLPHLVELKALKIKRLSSSYTNKYYIKENYPFTEGIMKIAKNLYFLPQLNIFEIVNYEIGSKGASLLAAQLTYTPRLRVLTLDFTMLDDIGIINLAKKLCRIPFLEELSLCYNWFSHKGIKEFSKKLEDLPFLKKMHLTGNTLVCNGLIDLAHHFSSLKNLRELMLGDMEISKPSSIAISQNIQKLTSLESLGFSITRGNYFDIGACILPENLLMIQNQIDYLDSYVKIIDAPISEISHPSSYINSFYGVSL